MRVRRIYPGLLALTLIGLIATAGPAHGQAPLGNADGFFAALHEGKGSAAFRYRFEFVDQATKPEQALASTLRTALRYQTKQYRDFDLFLEATTVADVGSGPYSIPGDPATMYPVVADPTLSRMNQAFLRWSKDRGAIKGGRQELVFDNWRFIGNVVWRQTHQTFDAARIDWKFFDALGLRYTFIGKAHTILDVPVDVLGHLLNASYDLDRLGSLGAYGYLLDFEQVTAQSSNAFGGFWKGDHSFAEGPWGVNWRAEYAIQQDAYDNPGKVDASYMHFVGGFGVEKLGVKVALEQLSGDAENGRFTTPFATAHKFNGWADKFLATPDEGLNDFYVNLGGKWDRWTYAGIYHNFSAESSDASYGTEIDGIITFKTDWNQLLALKAAFYSGDDEAPGSLADDVTKIWFYTTFTF